MEHTFRLPQIDLTPRTRCLLCERVGERMCVRGCGRVCERVCDICKIWFNACICHWSFCVISGVRACVNAFVGVNGKRLWWSRWLILGYQMTEFVMFRLLALVVFRWVTSWNSDDKIRGFKWSSSWNLDAQIFMIVCGVRMIAFAVSRWLNSWDLNNSVRDTLMT